MCIVLMQLNHPDFAFIVANNRDEFLARPTAPSHWHAFPPPAEFEQGDEATPSLSSSRDGLVDLKGARSDSVASRPSQERPILSGIDVHPNGGGTWIGISRTGRFAALTNFTEPSPPPLPEGRGLSAYRSRGKLPRDWLCGELKRNQHTNGTTSKEADLDAYLNDIAAHTDEWPGFNVLCGQLLAGSNGDVKARIGYVSNRDPQGGVTYLPVSDGIISGCTSEGLSNSILSQPWKKVSDGRHAMDQAVASYDAARSRGQGQIECEDQLATDLFTALGTTPHSDKDEVDIGNLPNSILIPPFQRNEKLGWYATRTATVMLVRRRVSETGSGNVLRWWERDVHIVDQKGQVRRCKADNQRYYAAELTL